MGGRNMVLVPASGDENTVGVWGLAENRLSIKAGEREGWLM